MNIMKSILLGASILALSTTAASAQIELEIASPSSHNDNNQHVFVSFGVPQKFGAPNPSSTEVNLVINNTKTGFVNMSTTNGGLCSISSTPNPNLHVEICGCYYDLDLVDLSPSDLSISALYRSTIGGAVISDGEQVTIPRNAGPLRPAATAPMCAPIDPNAPNLAPIADAGRAVNGTGNTSLTLDGSGSWDPENDPLTYNWIQTSGPAVQLTDATGPQPKFWAPGVTTRTVLEFKLTVRDNQGNGSDYADNLTATIDPNPAQNQCPPWTRDSIENALSMGSSVGGGEYTINYTPTATTQSALLAEAGRMKTRIPNLAALQIKSHITAAGTGNAPSRPTGAVNGAADIEFNVAPGAPLPTPSSAWSSAPLTMGTWYQLYTKVNAIDSAKNLLSLPYPDHCLYSDVYFRGDGQRIGPFSSPQVVSNGGSPVSSRPKISGVIRDGGLNRVREINTKEAPRVKIGTEIKDKKFPQIKKLDKKRPTPKR